MASDSFKGREKARFPALFVFGLLRAAAVIIVAAIALGGEFAIPIAILVAIVAAAGIGYRLISGSNRSAERDSTDGGLPKTGQDRKSTRLNSSHANISYAVFCLKKKTRHHPLPDLAPARNIQRHL